MRKLIAIVSLTAALMLGLASVASGQIVHPSENRADQSVFGGPHCHENLISGKFAFPSHKAHIETGDGVFAAKDCPPAGTVDP